MRHLSVCLLACAVAASGCKGVVKGATRAARELDETGERPRTYEERPRTYEERRADYEAVKAELAEEARLEKLGEEHRARVIAELARFQKRTPEELWLPELRLQQLLESDAALDPLSRLPAEGVAAIEVLLAVPAIARGEQARAQALLSNATARLDAAPVPRDRRDREDRDVLARRGRIREEALLLSGRFHDAFTANGRRESADKYSERYTAGDLANLVEAGVLAEASGMGVFHEGAVRDAPNAETKAVVCAYRGLSNLLGKWRRGALEQLDCADEAARAVKEPGWNFQTLGRPFTADTPAHRCASRFYEAVRASTFSATSDDYLVGPLLGLRLCILAMPPDAP